MTAAVMEILDRAEQVQFATGFSVTAYINAVRQLRDQQHPPRVRHRRRRTKAKAKGKAKAKAKATAPQAPLPKQPQMKAPPNYPPEPGPPPKAQPQTGPGPELADSPHIPSTTLVPPEATPKAAKQPSPVLNSGPCGPPPKVPPRYRSTNRRSVESTSARISPSTGQSAPQTVSRVQSTPTHAVGRVKRAAFRRATPLV